VPFVAITVVPPVAVVEELVALDELPPTVALPPLATTADDEVPSPCVCNWQPSSCGKIPANKRTKERRGADVADMRPR
jgi:hypothetical protein